MYTNITNSPHTLISRISLNLIETNLFMCVTNWMTWNLATWGSRKPQFFSPDGTLHWFPYPYIRVVNT